jgi:hypothetical protein
MLAVLLLVAAGYAANTLTPALARAQDDRKIKLA